MQDLGFREYGPFEGGSGAYGLGFRDIGLHWAVLSQRREWIGESNGKYENEMGLGFCRMYGDSCPSLGRRFMA